MSLGPALIWKMGGDTSKFNSAIKGASSRTMEFKSLLKSIGPAFSVGFLIAGIQRLTAEISNTGKTARKLGVGVELLQEMRFAAELTGVAQTALDMGLQRFTRRLAEAAQGGGELKGVLEQYNIQLKNNDGTTRSNVQVLGDLAEVIKNTENPAEQLRIAFKAFDSEGAALVNTLRDGRAGLDEFRLAARKAGAVISKETVNQFEIFDDQITTVKTSLKGLVSVTLGAFLSLGTFIGETLGNATNWLEENTSVLSTLERIFDKLLFIEAYKKITDQAQQTVTLTQSVATETDKVVTKMEDLADQAERLTGITETYAAITESQRKSALASMSTQEQINTLLEREVEIYNTKVAPAQQGSKEWSEGMLELEKSRVQVDKLLVQLAKEEAAEAEAAYKAAEDAAADDLKATKELARASAKAAEEAAEAGSSAVRLNKLNLELIEAQVREDGKLVDKIEEQIKLESLIGRIMNETNVSRERAIALANGLLAVAKETEQVYRSTAMLQSGAADIDYSGMSKKELTYLLRDTNKQIFENRQENRLGIRDLATSGMMQAIVYNVQQELETRRQYENTSGAARDLLFSPFEQQALDRRTTPQSDSETQTRLLESIDDRLAVVNSRSSVY